MTGASHISRAPFPQNGTAVLLPHFMPHEKGLKTVGGRIIELGDEERDLVARYASHRPFADFDEVPVETAELESLQRLVAAGHAVRLQPRAAVTHAGQTDFILSPHVDDAALSLGGSMAMRARAAETVVLNIFSSQSFQTGLRVPADRLDEIAIAEDRLAGRFLGYQSRSLGLKGAQDRHGLGVVQVMGWTEEDVLAQARFQRDIDIVTEQATQAIRDAAGSAEIGRLFAPAAIGGHLDHVITALAAPQIAALLDCPIDRLILYEDLPYAAGQMTGGINLEGRVAGLEDIAAVAATKWIALSIFRTRLRAPQIALCRAHAMRMTNESGAAERRFVR